MPEAYTFVPLDIPGQPSVDAGNAFGISDSGLVLVNATSDPSVSYPDNVDVNAVYNYRTGVYTPLPDVPGAVPNSTLANGINASGEIVGQYDAGGGDLHGFVLQHGVFTTLTPFGFPYSAALAVSDNGLVTGVAVPGTFNYGEGFILEGGVYTAIQAGPPSQIFLTAPQAINDAGTVVGEVRTVEGVTSSFIYQHGVVAPYSVPGWASTAALGINNAGDIVGAVTNDPTFTQVFGFVDDHGAIAILQFPGAIQTQAREINDQGVVDGYYWLPNAYAPEAFLAFPTHGGSGYSFETLPGGAHAASWAAEGHFLLG